MILTLRLGLMAIKCQKYRYVIKLNVKVPVRLKLMLLFQLDVSTLRRSTGHDNRCNSQLPCVVSTIMLSQNYMPALLSERSNN